MIKKLIVFLFLIISVSIYSQAISGVVQNEDKVNIEGVIIGVEGNSVGDITDKNGSFNVNFTDIDKNKILIAYLGGYELYKIKILDFINQKSHDIILKEKTTNIEPVILSSNHLIEKNIGVNSKSKSSYCGFNSKNDKQLLKEFAIRFKNDKKIKLKNININLSGYKINKPMMLIFDVYSSKGNMPNQSLLLKSLSKVIKDDLEIKNNVLRINVSDENIWVEDDFFVSVRVANDFDGYLYLSGNVFAMFQKTYYRYYYDVWKSYTGGAPSINLDVLIKK